MKRKVEPVHAMRLASFGVVEGGEYDGWRYAFLGFTVRGNLDHFIRLRLCRPNWPFPVEAELQLDVPSDWLLCSVPGERAPRVPTGPLLVAAHEAHYARATTREAAHA